MSDGWAESADGWIASLGENGDWARRHVLDRPMLARVAGRGFATAVDIGCGEGRFCRMLQNAGIRAIGIDPTERLIAHARSLDPVGDYRVGRAESLDLPDASVDLAVFYLSLIDIPDIAAAISEAHRVLRAGGTLLIANLQSFNTAGPPTGWTRGDDGIERFFIDNYLDERSERVAWADISVTNWHRPLGRYISLLLDQGFALTHFDEPGPIGATPERTARYRRVPWFLIMEWRKTG